MGCTRSACERLNLYFGAFQHIHAPKVPKIKFGSQAASRNQLSVEIHASGGSTAEAA